MQTFFSVVLLASALGLIISVLLQEGSDEGMGAIGGSGGPSTLWGKSNITCLLVPLLLPHNVLDRKSVV